jgi:hypothetical protein
MHAVLATAAALEQQRRRAQSVALRPQAAFTQHAHVQTRRRVEVIQLQI